MYIQAVPTDILPENARTFGSSTGLEPADVQARDCLHNLMQLVGLAVTASFEILADLQVKMHALHLSCYTSRQI